MTDGFEYKGIWFLPETPDKQIPGTLIFNPISGIQLELTGTFIDSQTSGQMHKPEIVLGYTVNGKLVTLVNCIEHHRSFNVPGFECSFYTAKFILLGNIHFINQKDLKFNSLTSSLINLENWANIYGFEKIKPEQDDYSLELFYKLPKPVEFNIDDGFSGKLSFSYSVPLSRQRHKFILEQKAEIILKYTNAKNLKDIMGDFTHFTNFITLGVFETSYPLSIYLTSKMLVKDMGKGKANEKIQVFYMLPANKMQKKTSLRWEFLFRYTDINENFADIIKNWYRNKEKIKPITDILFDNIRNTDKFNENTFLNMAQALEAFHRRFRNNEIFPNKEHREIVENLMEIIDPKYKEWLSNRLNYGNEPTLQSRLDELINEHTNKTLHKIIKDYDQFTRDVKHSRNYYTHYDKKLAKKAKKGNELYILTEKLKVILICAVLKETGFDNIQIEKMLERNEWNFFNHIIDN